MNTGISVTGPNISKTAVQEFTRAILRIINSPAGDDVKKHALDTLAREFNPVTTISNVSIQDIRKNEL